MDREDIRHAEPRRRSGPADRQIRRQRRVARPTGEGLEGRLLMTRDYPFPLVPPNVRNVLFDRTIYSVQLDGPGLVRVRPAGRGAVGIDLLGTTDESVVSIDRKRSGPHAPASALRVGQIDVRTGQLGAIRAGAADLTGTVTTLDGPVQEIEFRTIGPKARIDVTGSLGTLEATAVQLGPTGRIHVGGDLTGSLAIGTLDLDGGMLIVDQNLPGTATLGTLRAASGGRLAVGRDVAGLTIISDARLTSGGVLTVGEDLGTLSVGHDLGIGPGSRLDVGGAVNGALGVAGTLGLDGGVLTVGSDLATTGIGRDLRISSGGSFAVGRDATGPFQVGNQLLLDAGSLTIGRDLAGQAVIGDDLALTNGATLTVARDVRQPLVIGDDLTAASGSVMTIGRDLAGLDVGGDLDTSGGGALRVGGNVGRLNVGGVLIGKNLVGEPDLSVGLNLNNLTVRGFLPNRGGIVNADIAVGKSLVGLDIRHGIFNSRITADVLIDGGTPLPGGNIGPDGPIAVFDSDIRAGVQIRNLTINGDVVSSKPSNPAGRPTRIVAGQNRAGVYSPGGSIDNFQITGALIDAVIAASVAPEGGNGQRVEAPSDVPGDGTYDAPAGVVPVRVNGAVAFVPHYSPASYDAEYRLTGYVYDTTRDPTIDDAILDGSINRSFSPAPATPTRSTVLGGVIQTRPHGDELDFPGLFAADTRGVFVGTLPEES